MYIEGAMKLSKKLLISILISLSLIAGTAVGATVLIHFETPRTGQYTGSPPPDYTYNISSTSVGSSYGYWALPIEINTTLSVSITYDVNPGDYPSSTGLESGLMSASQYSALTNNTSISYVYQENNGQGIDYTIQGVPTIYFVIINQASSVNSFSGSITVTVS